MTILRHDRSKAPSSSEEGVGGGASRTTMLSRAAAMRANPTEPERRLWNALRGSRLGGHKFRRQATVGYRIVDFFCPAKGLIVEVDGDTHDRSSDLVNDATVERKTGFYTVRFTNEEVTGNLEGVLTVLTDTLGKLPDRWDSARSNHPPTPSFEKEGE